ncbi:hypothetical protein QAD02_022285 [Eretmocerus hayati]|uniref:Uncharacterized protein n=1 Tax=Eretmocerus hayati TaxID=131215 RepID=A0ACC2PU71_9HYME|nr:hypothetical protein QAD02_022285 [Eretmocerus hayati]
MQIITTKIPDRIPRQDLRIAGLSVRRKTDLIVNIQSIWNSSGSYINDAINDGSVSNGTSSLGKDKDDAVLEEWTPMSPEQFQFVVVKFLQNLDKDCTKQFGELNRKVGLLTKKVDKLQTKVESIACTPVTMNNTIDNEMRKYLKPADMDKFQELEDNLKNAKFHNKMVIINL